MDVMEKEHLTQKLQRREAYLAEAQGPSHTGSSAISILKDPPLSAARHRRPFLRFRLSPCNNGLRRWLKDIERINFGQL